MVINFIQKFSNSDFYTKYALSVFAFFIGITVIFFKECTLNFEYAYEICSILNGNGGVEGRWGSYPWRIFMFLGSKIGLSLNGIVFFTSVLFLFFKMVGWYLLEYVFENRLMSLLMLMSIFIGLSSGYYMQGQQAYNASFFVIIFIGILTSKKFDSQKYPKFKILSLFLLLLVWFVINTYVLMFFLIIVPLFFITFFNYKNRTILYIFFFSWMLFFFKIGMINGQDQKVYIRTFSLINKLKLDSFKGVFVYFLTYFINLIYLIPFSFFCIGLYLLSKRKRYIELFSSIVSVLLLIIALFFLLSGYIRTYPYASTGFSFIEGSVYPWVLLMMILFFYSVHVTGYMLFTKYWFKYSLVFVTIFYSSLITLNLFKQFEYNNYLSKLIVSLEENYDEDIFIIHRDFNPLPFLRLEFATHYESVLKSTMFNSNRTISIYMTSDTIKYNHNGSFPVFVNQNQYTKIDSFDLNNTLSYDSPFNPETFYKGYNNKYFKFRNYNYRIVERSFMDNFNKKFGFPNSEY